MSSKLHWNPPRALKMLRHPLWTRFSRPFGEWIVNENWDCLNDEMSSTEQSVMFEQRMIEQLNKFCPEKEVKISSPDKLLITSELKKLKRQKSREYIKRGKSEKYKALSKLFQTKYKAEAEKYLNKNLDALRESNPGQAYSILKKMGAQPGDCVDGNTFTLPSHENENLSDEEAAEKIADHFATISQEYPPLAINKLPGRVQTKLKSEDSAPLISDYEAYRKIRAAKKPRSGVPNDLPKKVTQEFSPELANPISKIVNKIAQTGEWPKQWKLEHVVPIGKIPMPETEDALYL